MRNRPLSTTSLDVEGVDRISYERVGVEKMGLVGGDPYTSRASSGQGRVGEVEIG